MLLHSRARCRLAGQLNEPVVLDHFETFEFSQDLPFSIATPVGAHSWYAYELDPVPHDRTGRRSTYQQARLDQRPSRPARGGMHGSTRRIVDLLLQLARPAGALQLDTDGHVAYHDVVTGHPEHERIRLSAYPNPDRGPKGAPRSVTARLRDRAMFPVDLWHRVLRHSLAHYHRETIAFGRRLNALLDRTYLTLVWRNFIKGRSERKPDPTTPAMRLHLATQPWTWRRLLARRLFPAREPTTSTETTLYRRDWFTPVLPHNRTHRLQHAY
jgi:hypothetical protein